ncbi:MAG TPA: FG-GAP-like repeat-containing protein [Blastocatellia bacterium]|nr:FG-GAP-like repeat-containing protein [Blastocatellia bacterium]
MFTCLTVFFSTRNCRLSRHLLIPALCLLLAASNSARRVTAGMQTLNNPVPVVTVAAASYETSAIAPEGIVAAFGTKLATATLSGDDTDPNTPGVQLPVTLGGTTVEVGGRTAGLFFVSPFQVNFIIPASTAAGTATVVIRAGDGTVSTGTVQVSTVAPSIFTANSDGGGVPAAYVVRVKANGQQLVESLSDYDAASSRYVTRPVDLGPDGELVVLVLFASGLRKASDPNGDGNVNESVRVTIGGREFIPDFAGKHPFFVGLDQLNVLVPRNQIGRGKISLSITGAGIPASNLCQIELAGVPGNAPPVISGFSATTALAGQTLNITGSGFSTNAADNLIRIGGVEARLVTASATQLSVIVPFGAETGAATVRTPQGEGKSSSALPIRTSVSGFIENTSRQPISGVRVRVSGSNITATSGADGLFILPDLPAGAALIEVDGTTAAIVPPFPKVTLKQSVSANRDNPFSRPIALQQTTGTTFAVGSSSPVTVSSDSTEKTEGRIETGNVVFELPENTTALFPDGATSGLLTMTVVENSRTPVNLPPGTFSSSVVQFTPFGVKLSPGGRLTFPNTQAFPAGTQATLFRYDPNAGSFVQSGTATVSADGRRLATAANAITETSYYFASVVRPVITVIGRVVENDRTTPVRGALVQTLGQEAFSDGNGGFILRNVGFNQNKFDGVGGVLDVFASVVRPDGRIDRTEFHGVITDFNSTIDVSDIVLPGEAVNRPPVVLAPASATVNIAQTRVIDFTASDPDPNQTVSVTLSGDATFAALASLGGGLYRLTLAPNAGQAGSFTATLTASDNLNATTTQHIAITVTAYPDLAITMTDSPDPVIFNSGQNLTYTINVTNNGPVAATGVVVTDTLPANAVFISATPGAGTCSQSGGVVTCNLGNLAVNASAGISIVITPPNPVGITGCAAVPAGQVAWYRGEGNANDAAGSSHGALQGNATYAPGKVGQAFNLNGTNAFVQAPHTTSLTPSAQMTLEAWINPSALSSADNSANRVIDKENQGTIDGYLLDVLQGRPRAIFGGLSRYLSGNATIPLNAWTHLAAVYDGAQIRLYVNGTLDASAAATGAIPANTLPLRIGANQSGGELFQGLIDEPGIYNRALTASEIQAVFNASSAGKCVRTGCDTPGFATAAAFDTGTGPQSVAVADFNGDGRPDLAVANYAAGNVSVLPGNGSGGFGAATNFSVGDFAYGVAVADFNGDGKPDLAVTRYNSGSVAVMLGDGTGGFGAPTGFIVGSGPRLLTTGDFNGDGRVDLAVANSLSGNVSVLLGNGVGGFSAANNFIVGTTPFAIAVSDFNGDGRADLAVANNASNNAILLGDGAGGFSPVPGPGIGGSRSVASGDLNGDGRPDLVFTQNNSVLVLLGSGTGSFSAATSFNADLVAEAVTIGDFNSDGRPDLVVANRNANNISVLSGNGTGGFAGAINFAVGTAPVSVAAGDFNRDGRPDLVTANLGSNNASVLLSTCASASPGFIINGASVSSSVPDPLPFNNLATVRTVVLNQ